MFERLLHTCLRPRVVYNSFGDKIVTSCGKCAYCVNKRGAYFSRLCECESNDNAYTYFVTLTYSKNFIPKAYLGYTGDDTFDIFSVCRRDKDNYGNALALDVKFPLEKAVRMCNKCKLGGLHISYPLKSDLQNFLKRLRIILKRKYNIDEKIRYYAVSEYGPKSFRIHFHLLFYFNSSEISSVIGEAIRQAWRFGRVNYSKSRGHASNYVASYINSACDLPSIYQNRFLCPFSSHSKYFGTSYYRYIKKEIYADASFLVNSHNRLLGSKSVEIFPSRSLKLLFFPKCNGFSRLNSADAVGLYRLYYTAQNVLGYQSVPALAKALHSALLNHSIPMFDWLFYFLGLKPVKCFYPQQIQRLESLLYTSKHFIEFCCDGSFDYDTNLDKVRSIYKFWSDVALRQLSDFYSAQVALSDACTDKSSYVCNLLPFYFDNWHKILRISYHDFVTTYLNGRNTYYSVLQLSNIAKSFDVSDVEIHLRKIIRKMHNDANNMFY